MRNEIFLKTAALLLLTSVSSSGHAVLEANSPLAASTEVDTLAKRYTVKLVRAEKNKFIHVCSGVVLGPGEVLSAAHCTNDGEAYEAIKKGQLFVEMYDPNVKDKIVRIQVQSQDFKDGEGTDLSLLKLTTDAPVKASLPLAYAGCDPGSEFVAAGFGLNEKGKYPLQAASVRYREVTRAEIEEMVKTKTFKEEPEVDKKLFFLRPKKGSVCKGDSGGPIFCKSKGRWAIAGINTSIAVTRMNLMPKVYRSEEYCKYTDFLTGNRIDQNMQLIESWRKNSLGVGKSNSAVK